MCAFAEGLWGPQEAAEGGVSPWWLSGWSGSPTPGYSPDRSSAPSAAAGSHHHGRRVRRKEPDSYEQVSSKLALVLLGGGVVTHHRRGHTGASRLLPELRVAPQGEAEKREHGGRGWEREGRGVRDCPPQPPPRSLQAPRRDPEEVWGRHAVKGHVLRRGEERAR